MEACWTLVKVDNLKLRLSGKLLFNKVSLQFLKGNRYGLVGANGCGKTSFLKLLCGDMESTDGNIEIAKDHVLATLKQDQYLYENTKIKEVVLMGDEILWRALNKKEELLKKTSFTQKECEELDIVNGIIEKRDGFRALSQASMLLEGLGIESKFHDRPLSSLSGGYKLRVLLAKTLFSNPDILLLDEPTNHLDIFSIKWLASYLKTFEGILIFTSHDKGFLNQVASFIADVDFGTITLYKGNFDEAMKRKHEDVIAKQNHLDALNQEKEKLTAFCTRFGAKATKAAQARSKQKKIDLLDQEVEKNSLEITTRKGLNLQFSSLRVCPQIPLIVSNLSKSYGDKKVLKCLNFEVEKGQKIAFVGPNGIGKSTLLDIITQSQEDFDGQFKWSNFAAFSYFPQEPARGMDLEMYPLDWLWQFDKEASEEKIRTLLARVLFNKEDVSEKPLKVLSGGELSRLKLAHLMLEKANVLILDEPTNHLDLEAIDSLIEALLNFEGTLLFVSHNLYFVSKLATRVIEISSDGIKNYNKSFDEYLKETAVNYLSTDNALSKRFSHAFHLDGKGEKEEDLSWQARKKASNQRKTHEKNLKVMEDKFTYLELKLSELCAFISTPQFFTDLSRLEQEKYYNEKKELELKLDKVLSSIEELLDGAS